MHPATALPDPLPRGPLREMLAIALPMVVSQACETLMTVTDRLFLARLDTVAMNAAMSGGLTWFTLLCFTIGLTGYTTALVAQHCGAGRPQHSGRVVEQAVLLCLLAAPVLILLGPVAHACTAAMGVPAVQLAAQEPYLDILLWGSLLPLLRHVLACFFSGIGRTRVVMVSALVALLVNMLVTGVLVYGLAGLPALGIRGAAIGTLCGSAAGLAVLLAVYCGPSIRQTYGVVRRLRLHGPSMRLLLRHGSPGGTEFLLNLIAFNLLITTFHAQGLQTGTAVTVVFNWDMVSFVPLIGVHIAITSLVGRCMGAGDPDSARAATRAALLLAWGYACCTLIAFAGFPALLVDVFAPATDDGLFAAARPLAVDMLRLASIYVLADATILVYGGALRGAGDTLWAMWVSVAVHWTAVPLLIVLLRVLDWPPLHAWMVLVLVILAFAGVFVLRYRSGRWTRLRILPEEPDTSPPADGPDPATA